LRRPRSAEPSIARFAREAKRRAFLKILRLLFFRDFDPNIPARERRLRTIGGGKMRRRWIGGSLVPSDILALPVPVDDRLALAGRGY